METGVFGVSGVLVVPPVVLVFKKEQDNATILLLNLVEKIAMAQL